MISEGSGEEDFLPATPTPHHEANCLLNHRRNFTNNPSSLDHPLPHLNNGISTPSSINNHSNSSR